MGWTGIIGGLYGSTPDQFFRREFNSPEHEIIASATKMTTYYAAVRSRKTGEVWALVVLMQGRNSQDEFCYKEMDETMGPYSYDCPERILDLLTPTTDENALAWRAECRRQIAERKAQPKLKQGMTVRLVGAENYSLYEYTGELFEVSTYKRYIHSKPRRCFRSLKNGMKIRFPRSAQWEVVVPQEAAQRSA